MGNGSNDLVETTIVWPDAIPEVRISAEGSDRYSVVMQLNLDDWQINSDMYECASDGNGNTNNVVTVTLNASSSGHVVISDDQTPLLSTRSSNIESPPSYSDPETNTDTLEQQQPREELDSATTTATTTKMTRRYIIGTALVILFTLIGVASGMLY
ncbi:hypothetical protein BX661DRAFT_198711 [Kickxella alabastrina]|uniref:uncharacterized protein n=1 Tax=Kickxella alabastrina TaxID=61397 RepID=UPI00221F2215|nr:uncharacterized protein BX661DRAFT_198711 [Kickxella alabastrina]KAI7826676.1 hypothetical protein BX661DRAFT_198711 [Kickxella alabastrina]